MGIFYILITKIDYTTYFEEQKKVNIVYGIDEIIRGMKQKETIDPIYIVCMCICVK